MTSTIKIGKRTFTFLFPDLLRPLNETELAGLRSDIKTNGVRVPVIVDESDGVIDGINRLTLAAEAGWGTVPVDVYKGLTHEEKHALAKSVNAHRRHCTRKELQEAIAKKLIDDPSKSNRRIAEEVGASDKTVAKVREKLEGSTAEFPQLTPPNPSENGISASENDSESPPQVIPKTEKRIGADGKARTTTPRPPKAPKTPKQPEPETDEPEATVELPPRTTDPFGLAIPDDKRDVFDPALERMRKEALSLCRQLRLLISDYAASPAGVYFRASLARKGKDDTDIKYRSADLTSIIRLFEKHTPYCSVCPYCEFGSKRGDDCTCCKGVGWVPADAFERSMPSEYQLKLEAMKEPNNE